MPGRWEPWPEKRYASGALVAVASTTPLAVSPRARYCNRWTSDARSCATTTARWRIADRLTTREYPMSRSSVSAWSPRNWRRPAAWARSASAVRADNTIGYASGLASPGAGGAGAGGTAGVGGAGGASRMRWALVPLIPNDETAARWGRSPSGHGVGAVSSWTVSADQSTWLLGVPTCRVGGRVWCCIARIILITPAIPAAAWVWPMLDLIDPSHRGVSGVWCGP